MQVRRRQRTARIPAATTEYSATGSLDAAAEHTALPSRVDYLDSIMGARLPRRSQHERTPHCERIPLDIAGSTRLRGSKWNLTAEFRD